MAFIEPTHSQGKRHRLVDVFSLEMAFQTGEVDKIYSENGLNFVSQVLDKMSTTF